MSTPRRPNVGFGFYKLMDRRIYFAREPPVKPQFTFQIIENHKSTNSTKIFLQKRSSVPIFPDKEAREELIFNQKYNW